MEEKKPEEEGPRQVQPSLFPLFPASDAALSRPQATSVPQWLCNSSFTADLSVINDAVTDLNASALPIALPPELDSEEEAAEEKSFKSKPSSSYELLESSSESDRATTKESTENSKKKKKKKRKRKRIGEGGGPDDYHRARKSDVRAWAGSETKQSKDYYFDSRGDPDNLAFGCLYRMDIARYKPYDPSKISGLDFVSSYSWNRKGSLVDRDGDVDALDSKLISAGRYWSAKYTALERHKNLKRVRLLAPQKSQADEFIPLTDILTMDEGTHGSSISGTSMIEESWEDEVLRKTREFNKLTREQPHNEKIWLAFAEFQDKVASMQPQKGARLQTLEKKISILEKAAELNPDNEDLLLCLLKAYQSRDSNDVLIARWENILVHHPGSYKLWREFLHVVQGEFSRFKVSEVRKMYAHAIQALSAACNKHTRQVPHSAKPLTPDAAIVQLELGLVDIFISLCRFEWQAGYQELATALFQAEMEFSLFCPSLLLTEQSKRRLFEHFWHSEGARVGEEGAVGWSTWLEKEEENRQRVLKEETSFDDEKGGWTGWSEPLSKEKDSGGHSLDAASNDLADGELQEEFENDDIKQEEDTEALLKKLGIDVEAEASCEVKDTSIWSRWSHEESSRDHDQWMPVHGKSGGSGSDGTPDREVDEQLARVILYEDVNDYLFSLSSGEARLSLISHFIDFFGGKISQRICTNSSSWIEKILSLEALPDSMLISLRRVHEFSTKVHNTSGYTLEELLGSATNNSRRIDMMKFLRNAILLCLTAFPRNYILEEAALVAEELSVTKMNSFGSSDTPCRALAKNMLKSDRQDILLCGVYARREAAYGNFDHARRVFDMALSLIEGLPTELRSSAPLLYFWYAEAELANNPGNSSESSFRALHILSCLGGGLAYSPFKSPPSNLQLLRAHQGFKEKIRTVRSAWVRGLIDDQSVALICSASLFEELTKGWAAGVEVLDQAFAVVLPERRSHSYQLEYLFNYYVKMLQRHHNQFSLSKMWETISRGLQIYPFSPELFTALVEIGHLYTTSNKLRWMFDDFCHKKPSMTVWIFALLFEMSKGSSQHRIHALFERALANDSGRNSVLLWRYYIEYEINVACNPSAARRIFFRAIHACPWSKKLWLDGFLKLNGILTAKELSDLQEVMRDKELNLRTDIYEILLQDEHIS